MRMNRQTMSGHCSHNDLEPVLIAHLEAHKRGDRCAAAAFAFTSLPIIYRLLLREHMHLPDEYLQDSAVDAVIKMLGEVDNIDPTEWRVVKRLHTTARTRVADRVKRSKRLHATYHTVRGSQRFIV